jgi:hypothetical protein
MPERFIRKVLLKNLAETEPIFADYSAVCH